MNNEATLILPHQLFEHHPALQKNRLVIIYEHPHFFTQYSYHKKKLLLHRASMKWYQDWLEKKGYTTIYIDVAESKKFSSILRTKEIQALHYTDLINHQLDTEFDRLSKKEAFSLVVHETPYFLSPADWLAEQFKDKKTVRMYPFYRQQRLRMDLLVHNKKPIGGQWTFDEINRKPFTGQIQVPDIYKPRTNDFITDAASYVNKHFNNNPGSTDGFFYPITHQSAQKSLDDFLHNRLAYFGTYQDAIHTEHPFLFHSLLSSSLNNGLLTPEDVIEQTITYAQEHRIRRNNLEGFIRQIIGWREFVYGVYKYCGKNQIKSNYFQHTKQLRPQFWNATTGIVPIDDAIQNVLKHAYAHHIERLMVLGNIMLLLKIKPQDVYKWFMELFIDAYEWVMVPNIYGMSQFADGGFMTTKPYISSSNYLLKMSNYKKGGWCTEWDGLFWYFIHTHKKKLENIARFKPMLFYYSRLKPETKKDHFAVAQKILRTL